MTESRFQGGRLAFRTWRRARPFWGGLLTMLSGAEFFLTVHSKPASFSVSFGQQGFMAWVLPLALFLCGALGWFTPQRVFYGIIAVVSAVYGLIGLNLGGFVIGTLLGVLGGALLASWAPTDTGGEFVDPPAGHGGAPTAGPIDGPPEYVDPSAVLGPMFAGPENQAPGSQAESQAPGSQAENQAPGPRADGPASRDAAVGAVPPASAADPAPVVTGVQAPAPAGPAAGPGEAPSKAAPEAPSATRTVQAAAQPPVIADTTTSAEPGQQAAGSAGAAVPRGGKGGQGTQRPVPGRDVVAPLLAITFVGTSSLLVAPSPFVADGSPQLAARAVAACVPVPTSTAAAWSQVLAAQAGALGSKSSATATKPSGTATPSTKKAGSATTGKPGASVPVKPGASAPAKLAPPAPAKPAPVKPAPSAKASAAPNAAAPKAGTSSGTTSKASSGAAGAATRSTSSSAAGGGATAGTSAATATATSTATASATTSPSITATPTAAPTSGPTSAPTTTVAPPASPTSPAPAPTTGAPTTSPSSTVTATASPSPTTPAAPSASPTNCPGGLSPQALGAAANAMPPVFGVSTLTTNKLSMHGLSYDGIVNVSKADGTTIRVLRFSMKSVNHTPFRLDTADVTGKKSFTASSLTVGDSSPGSWATVYCTSLSGTLLGIIPLTFTPDSPPLLVLPELVLSNVTIKLVDVQSSALSATTFGVTPG